MKQFLFSVFTIALFAYSCKPVENSDIQNEVIIPIPVEVAVGQGYFELNENTQLLFCDSIEKQTELTSYIFDEIHKASGIKVSPLEKLGWFAKNYIQIQLTSDSLLHSEGYRLTISEKNIIINSNTEAGVIMALQTLKQLIYNNRTEQSAKTALPAGTITDFPKFEYRGVMLDVARHFFSVSDVKRFIDLVSLYKINKLHIHLTDDQGWRIEIKSWPKLTEIGASTEVGGGTSGYFTQKDFIEIVRYANLRSIEIIPEIDMPGHTNAALASYAKLNCNNKATKLYTGMRVGFSSLCTRKEITYEFIDDVIREIAEISPSKFIHIGGDESHSTKHDDYVYFLNRVFKILNKHGKTPIGWDEIADADIPEGTIVQHWRNTKNAQKAKSKGSRIIASPGSYAYLDMKYDSASVLGLDWAGHINVKKAYSWLPDTLINDISNQDYIGIEAPLWSETIQTIDDIEYLLFPRLPGYAEIGWSQDSMIYWEGYQSRLMKHISVFDKKNINYYKSPLLK